MNHPHMLAVFIAVFLNGATGLAGGMIPTEFIHRHMVSFLAFAAGTLLGAAFFHLLPEALETTKHVNSALAATLVGFGVFFVVERFLGSHAAGQSGHKHDRIGPLILLGDALHNATDGVAIASAFSIDMRTGIATTIAVIVHELPQEIGDYAILLAQGYSKARALTWLLAVQGAAFIGAAGTMSLQNVSGEFSPHVMAASAGGFIYIAAADLLPQLHRSQEVSAARKLVALIAGVASVGIVHFLMAE